MVVQTDLRAGSRCYKCGLWIDVDVDVDIDITIFGPRKRHKRC